MAEMNNRMMEVANLVAPDAMRESYGMKFFGNLIRPIHPSVPGAVNPLAMIGAGMAQNNMLGALTGMGGLSQRGNALYLQQLQQQMAQRQFAQRQALAQAQFGLGQEKLAEAQRHNLAMENRPTGQLQLLKAYKDADPDTQAAMEKLFSQGTNITMSAGEAESIASTESLLDNLIDLEGLIEGGADLSGFSGIWEEWKAKPTVVGAGLRATFGQEPDKARAIRLARNIEILAGQAKMAGVLTDQDFARIQESMSLIGGPDAMSALRDLKGQMERKLARRLQVRGTPIRRRPAADVPPQSPGPTSSTPPPSESMRVLSIKRVD